MFLIQLDRQYIKCPLSVGNMSHSVPHKPATCPTIGLFASGHSESPEGLHMAVCMLELSIYERLFSKLRYHHHVLGLYEQKHNTLCRIHFVTL